MESGKYEAIARALQHEMQGRLDPSVPGISPTEIPDILGRSGIHHPFNCYPGTPDVTCCDLAVFVSLKSPQYTVRPRKHLSFESALLNMIRHLQGLCQNTREAVLITDDFNSRILEFWQPNLRQIQNNCRLEIYLISPGGHCMSMPL